MKFFTVFVDRSGIVEIKLGIQNSAVDRGTLLDRRSDFAEFVVPADKDEGVFLRQKFGRGVSPQCSVVAVVVPGRGVRAWRVRT